MGWRDWPYWVKGGLIGILIFIVYYFLQIFFGLACMGGYNSNNPSFLCVSANTISGFIGNIFFLPFKLIPEFEGIEIAMFIYFVILFAIIGLIYGKIKNRNAEKH